MRTKILRNILLVGVIGIVGCRSANYAGPEASTNSSPAIDIGPGAVYLSDIPFKKGIYVTEAVKRECSLGPKLSRLIRSYGDKYRVSVINDAKPKKGDKILDIEIIHVNGVGGGAWTGSKAVVIEGKLKQNGKVLASFRGSRTSGGGAFSGFKGTCAILGRCVKSLGRDVARWLRNPVMDASLGEGG